MKKILLSITLVCCICCVSIAQNYKNLSVPVPYLKIPAIIQNASINTYKVELAGSESSLNKLGYNSTTIGDKLNLRAFVKVDGDGDAENRIVFRFPGYGNLYGSLTSKSGTVDGKP